MPAFKKTFVTVDKFIAECERRKSLDLPSLRYAPGASGEFYDAYLFSDDRGYTEYCWLVDKLCLAAYRDELSRRRAK